MAVRFVNATCATSTSAGNCNKVEAQNFSTTYGSTYYDDTNTARTSGTFQVTNGVSLQGAYVPLKIVGSTGTFTIALMEGATQRAITAATNVSSLGNGTGYYYIAFGTPYTASSGINYTLKITATNASQLYWCRSSTASDWGYAVIGNGDDATGYTSGDTLLLKQGITFTQDQSMTLAQTTKFSLILGDGATWNVPNPGSALTLDLGAGWIPFLTNVYFTLGTSGSPIAAGYYTITTSAATLFETGYISFLQSNSIWTSYFKAYGNKPTSYYLTASAEAAASQKVINTVESVPASWTVGDTLVLVGKDGASAQISDNVTYTLASKTANSVTLNVNIDYKLLLGGKVCNRTDAARQAGITIKSTLGSSAYFFGINGSPSSSAAAFILSGCYLSNWLFNANFGAVAGSGPTAGSFQIDSTYIVLLYANGPCLFDFSGTTGNNINYTVLDTNSSYDGFQYKGLSSTVTNLVVREFSIGAGQKLGNFGICGTNVTVNGFIQTGQINNGYAHFVSGSNINITNALWVGSLRLNGNGITISNSYQSNSITGGNSGIDLINSYGTTFNACFIGTIGTANTTKDIRIPTNNYSTAVLNNTTVGSTGITAIGAIAGSYLEFHNYNTTVGDHRTWTETGLFYTDSPYTNLEQEAGVTPAWHYHTYQLLSQTVASKQHYLITTAQVKNAAYYGGVHTAPKIDIYTDGNLVGGTINATLNLADSTTAVQTLSQAFTPSTSNNQVLLNFQTNTDATGTNADVAWTSAKVTQRLYGYNYVDFPLTISETLTYPIATITTPTANPFITQANQATVHAYSGIAYNSGTNTLTLSTSHTIKEVYDWVQDYLSLNPLQSAFFSTTDGTNYTATCNITINSSIALTGGGSISVGANTWTNSGTYDGIVITSTNRIVHAIESSLVSGATVSVYDTTNTASLYNNTVSGTSLDLLYTYTTDINVSIDVKSYGYVPVNYTSSITNTGQSHAFSQVADSFITVSNPTTVGAYTGISINHATQTMTITADHTVKQIYDYAQWDLTSTTNSQKTQWFTTANGIDYISTYNIINNNNLTGGGTINVGAKSYTENGTYDGIFLSNAQQDVHVTLSTPVSGSYYEVYTGGGTNLASGTASGSAISFVYVRTTDTAVTCRVRKFGYLESVSTGTITITGLAMIVSQVADPNTASYTAGIASDFTIDTSAKTITHTSGSTVYTTKDLYNWTMDYFASLSPDRMQKLLPLSAQTQFDFTLQNSYTMDDTSHHFLKGGSMTEAGGNTLWSNVFTNGTLASGTQIYIDQNGSTLSGWWGTNDIDVLIKVKTGGSLIDSGNIFLRSHRYTYFYDRKEVNLANGGRTAVAVNTSADSSNTTSSVTVAAYGITESDGLANHDIGDGLGAQPYNIAFDGNGKTVKQIYEWFKYITRDASGGTVDGVAGELYRYAVGSTEILVSPLGTFAGGVLFGAPGVWVSNIATADTLNYILTDNNGVTHQHPAPPVSITVTGIVDGSRIQVYDVTTSTELDNTVVSGTTTYTASYTYPGSDHTIRIRLAYTSGVTAKLFYQVLGTATVNGLNLQAAQVDDTVYNNLGHDGSAITDYSISGTTIKIFIGTAGVLDGTTSYSWWVYLMTTTSGIRDQVFANYTATDTAHYTFLNGQQFKNTSGSPVTLTGGVWKDGSGVVATCVDTTGDDIYITPSNVETYALTTGSGLTTAEHNKLMSDLTTAQFLGLK